MQSQVSWPPVCWAIQLLAVDQDSWNVSLAAACGRASAHLRLREPVWSIYCDDHEDMAASRVVATGATEIPSMCR